ncbi:ABC transporter permease [Luethyella okanaganae]|uniref:ABC transporter permease n=1 Tax=Luethyella okanaganae TaxID=69372 RepID=A0ABW1VER3_9MICO
MSTITSAVPTTVRSRAPLSALSFGGILGSEWIKLRSLRSTVWSYLITIALSLGMAPVMLLSAVNGTNDDADTSGAPIEQVQLLLQSSTFGIFFGQLVVAVLGVLVISGEYSTGMIRSTLTAVPRRLPALAAKAVVLFLATFVVGATGTIGAFFLSSVIFRPNGVSASLVDPAVILPLLGGALYLAIVAVFALGVGAILRSSAGGIAAVLGVLLLLPVVLRMIPADWSHAMTPYLISNAGANLFATTGGLSTWQNLLIVLGWMGASIAGAGILLRQRDA